MSKANKAKAAAVSADVKVIHARKAVATFYVPGDLADILVKETPEKVARRAYETLHACELTREQRLTLLRALVVLEEASL